MSTSTKGPVKPWVLIWFYVATFFGGTFLHGFLFNVQENFYTGTNDLYQLYMAAGIWQLSLTSASAVFYTTSVGLLIVLIIADRYTAKVRFFLLGLIAAGIVVYAGYEIFQVFFPAYYDRNFLDIAVATLASLILALPAIFVRPTD